VNEASKQLENAVAYLGLHIEQGPVLERVGLLLGVVLGTFGVERHAVRFTGQRAHSASTPMDARREALSRRRARRSRSGMTPLDVTMCAAP
jgi:N-carbamoyl-L-amino-acid hydrolase